MGSILNDDDRTAICQRIDSVTSASVPRWGRMNANEMLTHLKQSALMALGELPVACKSKPPFRYFHSSISSCMWCRSPRARLLRRSCWSLTQSLSTRFALSSCHWLSGSGPGRVKAMARFTLCLAGSRSVSGAWRRTNIQIITCGSSA